MASIPPRARLTATLAASTASFLANRFSPLVFALVVVMTLLAYAGLLRVYLKFVMAVLGPTSVMLIVIWGLIARAPPGEPMGADPRGGTVYAAIIAIRLAVLGGVLQ